MEFKGTKGKWCVIDYSFDENGQGYIPIGTSEKQWIAEAKGTHLYVDSIEEMKANALLISKSPEMFEMLQSFVNDFDNGLIEDFQIPRDRFEQLIKQATEL